MNGMKKRKSLTCIVCPLGCSIEATIEDGDITGIEGFNCKRGYEYAVSEITNPVRVLTTTVKIKGADLPVIPVKSDRPLPRGMLFDCMKVINGVELKAPVDIGDVVVRNILDTDVDIVATRGVQLSS